MLQGTNLEYIRIIPSFAESRVGENKTYRILKGKQTFLVLQNQIICGNIVAFITATFQRTIYLMAFFVDAEVTGMRAVDINGAKILLIWRVKHSQVFIQNICVLLLEDISIFRIDFVAIFIVFTVFSDLINKEQGQGLNALRIQFLFLLKVGTNGFTNLYAPEICFRNITDDFTSMDDFSISESDSATNRINLTDAITTILLHVFGEGEQVIIYAKNSCFTVDGFVVTNLEFNTCHRRLLWAYDDVF